MQVPVYFLIGHHDYDTPFEFVEDHFGILNALIKEIIWFEYSAHFPFYEEPDQFSAIMINKVLRETHHDY